MRPSLIDRLLAGKGQHHRHLQQHAEGVADIVGVEFGEAFGAIAALEQKALAGRDIGEVGLERARLTGKHQRRKLGERRLHPAEIAASSYTGRWRASAAFQLSGVQD